ncbi:MAG: DUF3857 domain-containing protein [Planctomycetota bacterium]
MTAAVRQLMRALLHIRALLLTSLLLNVAAAPGLTAQDPAAPGAQPEAAAPPEAAAMAAKGRGDYRSAMREFLTLLRGATDAGSSADARAAAMAEYFAVMAFLMARHTGDLRDVRQAVDAAGQSDLAAAHPAFADRLVSLGLQAALSTGDLEDAARRTSELRFLDDWWLIGPFDNERGAGFARALPPEAGVDLAGSYDGKKRPVAWRRLPGASAPAGRIDLDALVRPNDQVLCYCATTLQADRDRVVLMRLGSDEAYKVLLNGVEIAGRDVRRRYAPDQDAVPLALREGTNLLLLKICDQEGAFAFSARLTELDGAPCEGVTTRADPDDLVAASQTTPAPLQGDAGSVQLGALDTFAAAVEADAAPQDALRLAYLLAMTQPDDPRERRDHQLAKRAVEGMPDDPSARYLLAFSRIRSDTNAAERDENARRHDYQRILDQHPDHVQTLLELARLDLDELGAPGRAEELLRRALAVNEDAVAVRLELARALRALGLEALAHQQIETAATVTPAWPDALVQLAALREEQGDRGAATALLAEALNRRYSAGTATQLARLSMAIGRRDEALALLDRAQALAPFAKRPRMARARLLEAEAQFAPAIETLRDWLRQCPDDDETLIDLARLHGLAGDQEREREALRAALDLNPNRKDEQRLLEFLEADVKPFYDGYELDGSSVLAADTGPPADAAAENDPLDYPLNQRIVRAYRNGTTSEYRHWIARVLTDQGARRLSTYWVPHYRGEQRARLLDVRVHRSGGEVLRPTVRGPSVRMPPLRVGDAVEIRERVDDLGPTFFGDYFGLEHGFIPNDGSPCARSELTVILEPGREYRLQVSGRAPEPDRATDADGNEVWRFALRDTGRTEVEERRPSWRETEPIARITTYSTWEAFAAWWWSLVRDQLEVTPAMQQKVAELTDGLADELAKIAAIYRFVSTDVRYTAWEFGVHGYQPYSAPVIFERRHGDCKDKALLMKAMLGEIGVRADLVLIRAEGLRSADDLTLPMVGHFNHCITYLPPTDERPGMFLDGTATYHSVDTVPGMDQGAAVLLVDAAEATIAEVPWTSAKANRRRAEATVRLTAGGDAEVKLVERAVGNAAVPLRDRLGNEPGRRSEKLARRLSGSFGKVDIERVRCSELLDLSQPVEVELSFRAEGFARRRGNDSFLLPVTVSQDDPSPLVRAVERELALLLGPPQSEGSVVRYVLPDGFEPLELPAPTELVTPFGRYRLTFAFTDGELKIERERAFLAPRIEPAEYGEFRQFVTQVVQADRQRILIQPSNDR